MSGTGLVALPTSSDAADWSAEEKALVEAAGLVHVDSQSKQRTAADRPTVAAFLHHCARTGLDPIARQIYCIARKSGGTLKWQIQVSIDGARLVAERSGQYEGQTTPEFTADGVTWTEVWLSPGFPKAARVGVFRRGFREALYAVALWDAYAQTTYKGDVTEMWKRMGPLMLAKCAEMLALRKAFPHDLSGLYSAEEMSQAETPATTAVAAQEPRRVASAPAAPAQESIPLAAASEDWVALAKACRDRESIRALWARAEAAGEVGVPVVEGGPTLREVIAGLAAELPEQAPDWAEPVPEPSEWAEGEPAPVVELSEREAAKVAAFELDTPEGGDAA